MTFYYYSVTGLLVSTPATTGSARGIIALLTRRLLSMALSEEASELAILQIVQVTSGTVNMYVIPCTMVA